MLNHQPSIVNYGTLSHAALSTGRRRSAFRVTPSAAIVTVAAALLVLSTVQVVDYFHSQSRSLVLLGGEDDGDSEMGHHDYPTRPPMMNHVSFGVGNEEDIENLASKSHALPALGFE